MQKLTAAAISLVLVASAASAQLKPKPKAAPNVSTGRMQTQRSTDFRRITRDEAFKLYKAGQAVFVDVRSHQSFTYGHIKGALSIPGSVLIERFNEVPPGKLVITYCACDAEQSSGRAVLNLNAHGVKNAAALKGGYDEWKAARLPIAAGPK